MARAVKLSDDLVKQAASWAKVMHRSAAGQIEHWATIGRIVEDNPDLTYVFVKDILISMEEARTSQVEDYIFGEGNKS